MFEKSHQGENAMKVKEKIIKAAIEEFAENQSNSVKYPNISELAKLEHRRWCYFMASCGWEKSDTPNQQKDDVNKKNPCMCTWEQLKKFNPDMCKYDMLPILLEYKNRA